MSEKILEESWRRKVEEEKQGESHEEKALSVYYDIQELAEKDPVLANLFKGIERSIRDYARAVLRTQKNRSEGAPMDEIKAGEQHRRIIHNDLISSLRQLARNFHKQGLDINWRNGIGLNPEDRETLGQWALDVALGISEEKEE